MNLPDRSVRFDGWILDLDAGELLREGERIRLQEQPLQVLLALLEKPGQLVTREELVARLWPKGIVDFETGLNTAVRRLRAVLREESETPRYIETLPRRGYRFIGRIEEPPVTPAPPAQQHTEDSTLMMGAGGSRGRSDSLVVLHAPQQSEVGRRYPLDGNLITLGRGGENDIVFPSPSISRRHGRMEFRGGGWFLTDADSTNGTYLNDGEEPIREERLHAGDRVVLGDHVLQFLSGADADSQYQNAIFRIAITDGLTGLCNRRQFDTLLSEELARASHHRRALSLLLVGVNHLATINDTRGPLVGDAILRALAGTLRKRVRPLDRVARCAGARFGVLLPETNATTAQQIATELRDLVAARTFVAGSHRLSVTISTAVATSDERSQVEDLYRAAQDELLQGHA